MAPDFWLLTSRLLKGHSGKFNSTSPVRISGPLRISIIFSASASTAVGFLAKKSAQLKPIGSGLNLIILFISVQLFLHLGAAVYYSRVSQQFNFFSWLVFTYAALRLGLYV